MVTTVDQSPVVTTDNSGDELDDEEAAYESDYEYIDDDDDNNGNDNVLGDGASSKRMVAGLKTTGLGDDDDTKESDKDKKESTINPTLVQLLSMGKTLQGTRLSGDSEDLCHRCGTESHIPVFLCETAKLWRQHGQDLSSGILTLPPDTMIRVMKQRTRDIFSYISPFLPYSVRPNPTTITASMEARLAYILRHLHWNLDALSRRLHNRDDWLMDILQVPNEHDEVIVGIPPRRAPRCAICMDDEVPRNDMRSLSCHHEFCKDCWEQHIETMLTSQTNETTSHTCPHQNCMHVITATHIRQLAPRLLPRLHELELQVFLMAHADTIRWCPGPDCGNVAVHAREDLFLDNPSRAVFCDDCHTRFCFDCGEAPHTSEEEPCQGMEQNIVIDHQGDAVVVTAEMRTAGTNINTVTKAVLVEVNDQTGTTPTHDNPAARRDENTRNFAAGGTSTTMTPNAAPHASTTKKKRLLRKCAQCTVMIEKTGGCNYMRCKCGHEFCWLCGGNFQGNHFCGRLNQDNLNPRVNLLDNGNQDDQDEFQELEAAERLAVLAANPRPQIPQVRIDLDFVVRCEATHRALAVGNRPANVISLTCNSIVQRYQDLQRFSHFYNRYFAHEQGQEYANDQCGCVETRIHNWTKVSDVHSGADTEFFVKANQTLAASRRMLKYTYCYVYNNIQEHSYEQQNAATSALSFDMAMFLDHQERLERMTEQLSFHSENALTRLDRRKVVDLIDIVDKCRQSIATFMKADNTLGDDSLTPEKKFRKVV